MIDVALVLIKLQRLREQLQLVRDRRPAGPETLSEDLVLLDALSLALLVAVQEAIDVAYHIAADAGWGVPDSHAAAFDLLGAHGVVPPELARQVAGVARVRNRIAHGHASVDHERIWHELPEGIDALERFTRAVASWLPAPT